MKALKTIHSTLTKIDLFPAQQFLRYKGEPQYKTATGGFCSLLVIAIFFALFINAGLDVLNKVNVTSSFDIQHQADPVSTSLSASPEGKFMFAFNVIQTGIITANYTYFNVSLKQYTDSNLGIISNSIDIGLEKCNQSHFQFNQPIKAQYQKYRIEQGGWLCPRLGQQLKLSGNIVSNAYQYFAITIKKCDSTFHTNCAPDYLINAILANTGGFTLGMALVGTQINPSYTENYIDYFIEARNLFQFNLNMGFRANAQVEDYSVETDISLLPMTEQVTQQGAYVPELFRYYTVPVTSDIYGIIKFDKSPYSITFKRSFQKLDDFLSYVGGLVGLVFSFIFIMNEYSELCFEVSIGNKLFTLENGRPINSGAFNFLTYLSCLLIRTLQVFGCCVRSQLIETYHKCHEEVEKQLDIFTILQRITILERGMMSLIEPSGYELLYFREKPTIDEAQQIRKNAYLYHKYKRKVKDFGLWHRSEGQQSQNEEIVVFSDQSSISSIQSPKYKELKDRFQRYINQGQDNKCLDKYFRERLRKNEELRRKMKFNKQKDSQKVLLGDSYFRELQSSRLKEMNNGGWAYAKYNENDEL